MRRYSIAVAFATMLISSCSGDAVARAPVPDPAQNPTSPSPAPAPAPAPALTPNLLVSGATNFQTIDGLGVNANSAPYLSTGLAPAIDTLLDTAGVTHWRVIVESHLNWETTNDNSDALSFDGPYYNALYESEKFRAAWGLLAKLQARNVPLIMVNVMGNVPSFIGTTAIDPAQEEEWVELIVSFVQYARVTKRLRIDALSPMNETDIGSNEGPLVGSAQYVRLLKKLAARLDVLGFGEIRLVGPDTARVKAGVGDYMRAMLADSTLMAKVDRFALHSYSGDSGNAASVIASSAYPNRAFWMTEFSQWCRGCDSGVQPTNDWEFARGTFEFTLNHLRDGASGVFVYDAYDSFYEHHNAMSFWGLMSLDRTTNTYKPRKRFHALAQVYRFVRPGARRIDVRSVPQGVRALAFVNPESSISIVGVNNNVAPTILLGSVENLGFAVPTALRVVFTSTSQDQARANDISVINGRFSVQIPAGTIFTLTSFP